MKIAAMATRARSMTRVIITGKLASMLLLLPFADGAWVVVAGSLPALVGAGCEVTVAVLSLVMVVVRDVSMAAVLLARVVAASRVTETTLSFPSCISVIASWFVAAGSLPALAGAACDVSLAVLSLVMMVVRDVSMAAVLLSRVVATSEYATETAPSFTSCVSVRDAKLSLVSRNVVVGISVAISCEEVVGGSANTKRNVRYCKSRIFRMIFIFVSLSFIRGGFRTKISVVRMRCDRFICIKGQRLYENVMRTKGWRSPTYKNVVALCAQNILDLQLVPVLPSFLGRHSLRLFPPKQAPLANLLHLAFHQTLVISS